LLKVIKLKLNKRGSIRMKPGVWFCLAGTIFITSSMARAYQASSVDPIPRIEKKDGRFALMVSDKPYLMLGAQINNSSSWASTLPAVWPALEQLHVNTVEAPVYWELMEPEPGKFDFTNVDLLIDGAREHHLKLVLLWFGTWKNGQAHYVPEWMKTDTKRYPRELTAYGKVLDVMSPNSETNLDADKHAFAALMRHVKEKDASTHTVIMIQVENECGSVGSVRDFSPAANKEFAEPVPAALHTTGGSWTKVYGADADERFAAYSTARYINDVAKAGKAEYPLPMYCNVWITYPVHALENRDHPSPGQEYPSGGAQQQNISIWKMTAPSIDILAPDFYSDDTQLFHEVVAAYHRSDNPLFIPETGRTKDFGNNFFYALGHEAIGFSPFGVDFTNWGIVDAKIPESMAENFALIHPIANEVAALNFEGKLKSAVEAKGEPRQTVHFAGPGEGIDAVVSYGFPQNDGAIPPGTVGMNGRALVAQLGPMEFLVTGFDASVSFTLTQQDGVKPRNEQLEILSAEEGRYVDGVWQRTRIWNGDQTDRGLNFHGSSPELVRIRLHKIPLYEHHEQ